MTQHVTPPEYACPECGTRLVKHDEDKWGCPKCKMAWRRNSAKALRK